MGQKVNPFSFRLGVNTTWKSSWFATKENYKKYLHRDIEIRTLVNKLLKNCGIADIRIERSLNNVALNVFTSKPGMIIGKRGDNVDKIRKALEQKFNEKFVINIKEIKKPETSAELVGQMIAQQIEKRVQYRRAIKSLIEKVMDTGEVVGVKIRAAGRLNGVEISRSEYYKQGNIPLHTIRADIDFAKVPAHTTYGVIGLQIWIYKGEKFRKKKTQLQK